MTAEPGTGTISAALAAHPSGNTVIRLACGTYMDNIVITQSNITIEGAGVNCTFLKPAINSAMLKIDATNDVIQYVQVRDLTMQNAGFTSDGILISGPVNQINDWHYFRDLSIQGFQNNVNITGRTIWTTFSNVHLGAALNNGFNANTAAVLNHIVYRDGQINTSQNYGVYWNNMNVNASQSIDFDHVNVEANGRSGTQTNCAGMYFAGIGSGQIVGGYLESNCVTNPDGKGADIRVTGTYAQAFDIRSSLIWSRTNYNILNDAAQTGGTYEGNRFGSATASSVKISTSNDLSQINLGANFNCGLTIIPDGNGNTHVSTIAPSGDNMGVSSRRYNPITSNVLNAIGYDHIEISGGGTINSITGGYPGRTLKITSVGGTLILSTGGPGVTAISLLGGATSETIPGGNTVTLYYSIYLGHWVEVSPSSNITATTINGQSPTTRSGTPTPGAGVCWKTPTTLGTCTAGTWPNCTTCN
jgi:hypothetical protein